MIYSIYERKGESANLRQIINRSRILYSQSRTAEAINLLSRTILSANRKDKIILETCLAMLKVKTLTSESKQEIANSLVKTLSDASPHTINSLDLDIKHDIFSLLSFLLPTKEFLPNINILKILDAAHESDTISLRSNQSFNIGARKINKIYQLEIPSTGIFSFIEHICNAEFISKKLNFKIFYGTKNWKYSYQVENFFPSIEVINSNEGAKHCYPHIENDKLREVLFCYLKTDRGDFHRFKIDFYQQLQANLCKLFDSQDHNINVHLKGNYPVLYIRRGDKIQRETLNSSVESIVFSLQGYNKIKIISDDTPFARKVAHDRGHNDEVILPSDSKGYEHYKTDYREEELWETMIKWYIYSKASTILGDMESNWGNTAFFAKPKRFLPCNAYFIRPALFI